MSEHEPKRVLLPNPDARHRMGGICNTKFYELIASGKLEAVKLGRRTFVTAASVDAYVASLPRATINMGLKRAA